MDAARLESFWAEVKRELDEIPISAETRLVEPEQDRLVRTWRVTLTGLDDVRFRAFLAIPDLGPDTGPLPAVVYTPGYGGNTPHTAMVGLCYDKGFALLSLYPRGQGESAEYWQVPSGLTKLTMGLDDPHQHYYRGGIRRLSPGNRLSLLTWGH